jgi:peptidyl-tRNA hydrolase
MNSLQDVILAKPMNYFPAGNGYAAAAVMRGYSMTPRDLTVVHHSMDVGVGDFQEVSGAIS